MSKQSQQQNPNKRIIVKNIPIKNGKEWIDDIVEDYEEVIDYYDVIYPNNYFCSAIIHFKTEDDLNKFKRQYNGQTLYLPNGDKVKLDLMYSLNQRFTFENQKDELEGTLEDDLYFKTFVKNLNKK